MSRIGKQPIAIPAGVTVIAKGNEVSVKGKLGELSRVLKQGIDVKGRRRQCRRDPRE
jgi:large subunit ribosomal protein L6